MPHKQHSSWAAAAQPMQQREGPAPANQPPAAERLARAVVSSRMWSPDCQALQPPLPTHIPSTFANPQEYLSVFSPLLVEEAVEGVRSSFEEAERSGKGAAVTITACNETPEGWRKLTVTPASPQDKQALLALSQARDVGVVVLTLQAQQQQQQTAGQQRHEQSYGGARVTGVLGLWDLLRSQERILVKVRPWCEGHGWGKGSCSKAYPVLHSSVKSAARWWLTPAGSIVTAQRELNTLDNLQGIPILPYLLNPSINTPQGLLGPAAAAGGQAGEPALPEEVADSQFERHLKTMFDQPQVEAILKCAGHVQQPPPPPSLPPGGSSGGGSSAGSGSSGPPVCLIQGPPGTGKTYTVLGVLNLWHSVLYHRHYSSLDSVVQRLVQHGGQPGLRIDKVLLSEGFKSQLAPRPRILVCAPSNAATDELLERVMRGGFIDKNGNKYNPNMIRLGAEEALSSAAQEVWVEQLAGRLLAMDPQTFIAEHQAYQQEKATLTTSLANLAESVAAMRTLVGEAQAAAAADPHNPQLAAAAGRQLDNMQQVVSRLVAYFERLRVVEVELRRRALLQDVVATGKKAAAWAKRLGRVRADVAMQKQQQQEQQQQQQQQQQQREDWRLAFRLSPRELQQQLEVLYMEDAEMVFTTLSSSGREVFSRLAVPFPLVLLDEAGQATEVASLQPLVYGARGVVMVGDPQQLPATIFSQAGKRLALERSLFERLAAGGCPVSMLKVQYRMHPAIRSFPSAFFYNNELIDADSVLLREQTPWFLQQITQPLPSADTAAVGAAAAAGASIPPLNPADPRRQQQRRSPTPDAAVAAAAAAVAADGGSGSSSSSFLLPYGVFDVANGVEHSVGRSKANAAEAQLAVELYCQLRPALLLRGAAAAAEAAAKQELLLALPTDVGIVTPYRGQRDIIRAKLVDLFGPQELSRVRVETIDSFQGKQLDVVILSLTRASSSSGGGGNGSNAGGSNAAGAVLAPHLRATPPPPPPPPPPPRPAAAAAGGGTGGGGSTGAGGAAGAAGTSSSRGMLALNNPRAGVGFLSDVRRMNVAISRARLACLVLGHVDTLLGDAAWGALVTDAAVRGCLFRVPSVDALTQPQQQQLLLPLIQAARQQQDEMMLQLRRQRNLTLPDPEQQQQQQQQQGGGQMGLPPLLPLQQQQQPPGLRLLTPPPGLLQQQQQQQQQQQFGGAAADGDDRPLKQQKLDHPAPLAAAAGAGVGATSLAALQANAAAAAAAAAAAEEARKGSRHVYSQMRPEQAVVAWGLWPKVVELQQTVLMQQQQQKATAETQQQQQQQ